MKKVLLAGLVALIGATSASAKSPIPEELGDLNIATCTYLMSSAVAISGTVLVTGGFAAPLILPWAGVALAGGEVFDCYSEDGWKSSEVKVVPKGSYHK